MQNTMRKKPKENQNKKGLLCLRGLQWTKQKLLHFIDYMYSWDLASLPLNSKKEFLYEGAVTLEDLALFMWLESKLEWDQCPPCRTSVQLRVFTLLPNRTQEPLRDLSCSMTSEKMNGKETQDHSLICARMPQMRKWPTQSTCQFYYLL